MVYRFPHETRLRGGLLTLLAFGICPVWMHISTFMVNGYIPFSSWLEKRMVAMAVLMLVFVLAVLLVLAVLVQAVMMTAVLAALVVL